MESDFTVGAYGASAVAGLIGVSYVFRLLQFENEDSSESNEEAYEFFNDEGERLPSPVCMVPTLILVVQPLTKLLVLHFQGRRCHNSERMAERIHRIQPIRVLIRGSLLHICDQLHIKQIWSGLGLI